jgi:hypothetical protein
LLEIIFRILYVLPKHLVLICQIKWIQAWWFPCLLTRSYFHLGRFWDSYLGNMCPWSIFQTHSSHISHLSTMPFNFLK